MAIYTIGISTSYRISHPYKETQLWWNDTHKEESVPSNSRACVEWVQNLYVVFKQNKQERSCNFLLSIVIKGSYLTFDLNKYNFGINMNSLVLLWLGIKLNAMVSGFVVNGIRRLLIASIFGFHRILRNKIITPTGCIFGKTFTVTVGIDVLNSVN